MKGWNWRDKKYQHLGHGDAVKRDIHILNSLKGVKIWQMLVLLLIFSMLAAVFLRLNSLGALDLYEDLKAADKTADIVKVEKAAKKLQNFVASHMNSAVPRLPLQTLYEQAVNKALEAAKPVDIDQTLYQKVTEECASAWYNGGSRARAKCISEKIGASGDSGYAEAESITPDAYYIEFSPTRWSLDAAGITLLVCFLLTLAIVLRLLTAIILRVILKFKYRAL